MFLIFRVRVRVRVRIGLGLRLFYFESLEFYGGIHGPRLGENTKPVNYP